MIQLLTPDQFDSIFSIMEKSFTKDEYRTYEGQKALFEEPAYRIYGQVDEKSGKLNGFLSAWEFEPVVFFEHFAINPELRNGGIGGAMLREIVGSLKKQACLEVELPDNELASRRIGFYQRNGFYLNSYSYVQPAMAAGRNPVPLKIMTTKQPVSQSEFEQIRDLLYRRVYRVSENWAIQSGNH